MKFMPTDKVVVTMEGQVHGFTPRYAPDGSPMVVEMLYIVRVGECYYVVPERALSYPPPPVTRSTVAEPAHGKNNDKSRLGTTETTDE